MDKLASMKAFVAVTEAGGFSKAARKSLQTKALLSKYIAQLEENLGVRLLHRTTRKISLTEVGNAYYQRCLPLLEELNELEAVVKDIHSSPSGELTICAPVSFSEMHLMSIVAKFTDKYPKIRIKMSLTDRVIDIVEEGFDLAIRIGILEDSNLIAKHLKKIEIVACASQQYLQNNGEPKCLQDLQDHQCIIDTNYNNNEVWRFERNKVVEKVSINAKHYVNSAISVKKLALEHQGITICPTFVVSQELQSGKLKRVLPDYKIDSFGLYAVYSHRKHLSTKVQLFMNMLQEYFSEPRW